jgi:Tol biopolymer transport system component/DNA-binding winged helix-turn-helix (wHTH) protein
MLNQHSHTVIPESDHLRIGECVLDLPRREITSPHGAAPMRITVKSLQVLLVLVAQQGKVVSREALIEWVWADTMPSDDVLTQAITQLRKAFGDDRGAPRYLETIAKGGYRLLAPVEWIASPVGATAATMPDPVPSPTPAPAVIPIVPPASDTAPPRRAVAIAVGLAVLLAAGFGYRMLQDKRAADSVAAAVPAPAIATPAKPTFQRITSAPGSEMWPSLSPDGSQVVYSAYAGKGDTASLMVQTTAPVPPHQLTDPGPGVVDTMPAWSPNGREIAFTRIGPKDACQLLLMPAIGGQARVVSKCRPGWEGGFSWHPDGRHLVTSQTGPDMDGALYTIDLATGAWTRLPYQRDANDTDLAPAYSPDGRWIAFHRNVSVSDLWRVPASGGKPERLTSLGTNINSIAWTPDGKSIVFGMYLDGNVSLARLDLQTRKVIDMGMPKTLGVSVAANTPAAAFIIAEPHSAIYALDLARPGATPAPVFASSGVDLLPSVAPDGTQFAFVSDRSGVVAVWWARIGQPESLRLIDGVVPVPRYAPVWSADSARLLMIGRTDKDKGLYEINAESGGVQRLPVPVGDPVYAEYMPDPSRMLVVADRGAGRLAATLYDRSTSPWTALAMLDDVSLAKLDRARQRVLFTRASIPGLWQADLSLHGIAKISDRPAFGGGRRLVITEDQVRLAAPTEDCGLRLIELDPKAERPGACLHAEPLPLTGVSLDVRNDRLYFSSERDENSDIGWMRLPALAAVDAKPVAGTQGK